MKEEQESRTVPSADGTRMVLRERLTGAVILVVLVVLLVPALLTGRRPEPPAAGTSTSGDSRSYEISLAGPRRPVAEDPDQPLPEPEPTPVPQRAPVDPARPVAVSAPPEALARVAPTGVPRLPATVRAGATGSPAVSQPASASPEAVIPGEAPRPGLAAGEHAPGPAAPVVSAAAAPFPAPDPDGGAVNPAPQTAWAVQLGAFAGRETAARLVANLRAKGFAAFMLEYRRDGKVLYRVRVGPEQDRERALAIAERLDREGYKVSVAPHP